MRLDHFRLFVITGETSFSYEREVQPRPELGRWNAENDRLLTTNAESTARERLTLIRIFEELRALGYEGGYDAVRRYARTWSREYAGQTAASYVPSSFAPGEAYQFDWSHEIVVRSGVVDPAACTPASDWEKGQVENQVGLACGGS